jgi:HAD superfamily hydrolase (TIGR01490 family)
MHLALFDLDHTLLPIDSDHGWADFLISIGVIDGAVHKARNDAFYQQYSAGTLNMQEFLGFALSPLAQNSWENLQRWREQYMAKVIAPNIRPEALALVRQHQDQGALCALVTATNEFITAPIAKAFGIEHLVATRLERSGEAFTGRPLGVPCFKEGKIVNLKHWLDSLGRRLEEFDRSFFYSDSANDIPLMSIVTDPVATNPDPRLLAHAQSLNWPVLALFSPDATKGAT